MAEEAPNAATHDLAANLEEDSEGLYEANEWLRSAPKIKPKLFAFDWSHGYISPFRATPVEKLKELCDAISAQNLIQGDWSQQIFYDLGCGNGIVNIEIATLYGTRGVGLDLDEKLIFEAKSLAAQRGMSHLVDFRVEDILQTDLSECTVVFMFLLPEALEKLKSVVEDFLNKLPDRILIVEQWTISNWEDKVLYNHNQGQFRVYGSRHS